MNLMFCKVTVAPAILNILALLLASMVKPFPSIVKLLLIKITEEIDHHSTEKIRRLADNEITRYMPRKVLFDFGKVSFMDSAGIGMIIGRYKTANMLGGTVEMTNVKPSIHIFFLSFILNNIVIKKINIHIAHGLNPSIKPIIFLFSFSATKNMLFGFTILFLSFE